MDLLGTQALKIQVEFRTGHPLPKIYIAASDLYAGPMNVTAMKLSPALCLEIRQSIS